MKCTGIKKSIKEPQAGFLPHGEENQPAAARNFILSLGSNTQEQMGHLTLHQRYKIEAYRKVGKSLSEIGEDIGKDKSVISPELLRNSDGRSGEYKAALA